MVKEVNKRISKQPSLQGADKKVNKKKNPSTPKDTKSVTPTPMSTPTAPIIESKSAIELETSIIKPIKSKKVKRKDDLVKVVTSVKVAAVDTPQSAEPSVNTTTLSQVDHVIEASPKPVSSKNKLAKKDLKTKGKSQRYHSISESKQIDTPIEPTKEVQVNVEDIEEEEDDIRVTFDSDIDSSDNETHIPKKDQIAQNAPLIKLTENKVKDDILSKINKMKVKKGSKSTKLVPGVCYLGRIPHGFFEVEMKKYFEQFGNVTRLRLSRNKKTGASKHFGFIEFESVDVAKIVAETMDSYLIMGKLVDPSKVHAETFKGSDKVYKPVPWQKVERLRHNRVKNVEQVERIGSKLMKKDQAKRDKLAEMGIDYTFAGYQASTDPVVG